MKLRIIQLCPSPRGMYALTDDGRIFERVPDDRNFDARAPEWKRQTWREITLPDMTA